MCNGIPGVSGMHTREKQDSFRKFVEHQIKVVENVKDRGHQVDRYDYYDPFAGPGYIYCDCGKHYEGDGSPLIFHKLIRLTGFDYQMILAEADSIRRARLKGTLNIEDAHYTLKNDARDCCIPTNNYGMVYIDPPMNQESFTISKQLMIEFSRFCPRVDIVFSIGANFVKRFKGNSHLKFNERLTDLYSPVKKEHWFIREPIGANQYTFLIGSNFNGWAEWKSEGFYNIKSYDGQRILLRLNYNEPEQKFITYGMIQKGF